MQTKKFNFNGKKLTLLRYKNMWVFPLIQYYDNGMGCPVAMSLYCVDEEGELELYTFVTVNIPDAPRKAGCQYIDTNKNAEMLDWLEQNNFGQRTGNTEQSGFCTYPEFNFYEGEKFWEYKKISEELE